MIILDPTAISDASFSRASTATYVDTLGVMQTADINALRFTHDPSDLTLGARALVEPAATNQWDYSNFNSAGWGAGGGTRTINAALAPDNTMSATKFDDTGASSSPSPTNRAFTVVASEMVNSFFVKAGTATIRTFGYYNLTTSVNMVFAYFDFSTGTFSHYVGDSSGWTADPWPNGWFRIVMPLTGMVAGQAIAAYHGRSGAAGVGATDTWYLWGADLRIGTVLDSHIPSPGAGTATRAADIVGASGTVLGSNVPENDAPVRSAAIVYAIGDQVVESHSIYQSKIGTRSAVTMTIAAPAVVTWAAHALPADTPISFTTTGALPTGLVAGTTYYVKSPNTNDFNLSLTPGGAAITTTGSQSGVHTATAGQNFNRTVSDLTYWQLISATNQRKMVDQYNNTQTTNADVIILTFTPRQIAQGVYLGGLDADTVSVVMEDTNDGIVYSATESLVISNSESSLFNWLFRRIRRKTYFFTGALPVYSNARITITLRRTGGTAKCGMCVVGPLIDIGMSQYGLSTEIKDYSSSIFAFDGTSSTIERGYAKLMSVDLYIANDQIDFVQEQLADFRARNVVYVGATMYGSAINYGRFTSFKNVITYPNYSIMALSIQGTV